MFPDTCPAYQTSKGCLRGDSWVTKQWSPDKRMPAGARHGFSP